MSREHCRCVLWAVVLGIAAQAGAVDFHSDGYIHDHDIYNYVTINEYATVTMTGGRVSGAIDLYHHGRLNLSGGHVGSIVAADGSTVNISGGQLDNGMLNIMQWALANVSGFSAPLLTVRAWGHSTVTIYGYGFGYDPHGGNDGDGQITGYWPDTS